MPAFGARNVVDYATLTVDGAVGLADASPAMSNGQVGGKDVHAAYMTVETDQIRWRPDGDDPSSTEGHLLNAGDSLSFMEGDYQPLLNAIKFIKVTNAAKIKITYFE